MHDALTIGIAVLVILFGILLNRADLERSRREINERFDRINVEYRYFHDQIGELRGRIDELNKR